MLWSERTDRHGGRPRMRVASGCPQTQSGPSLGVDTGSEWMRNPKTPARCRLLRQWKNPGDLRSGDGLPSILNGQFPIDVACMLFHRRRGDHKRFGDLCISPLLGQQKEYLQVLDA